MLSNFSAFNIWEHSRIVKDLYLKRARDEAEEMTCAQQAAQLLVPFVSKGDKLVDVGCGSGYFYHTLRKRQIDLEYFGFDQTASLIEIGQSHLPAFGLAEDRLQVCRIEDFCEPADHFVCMNVLSNIDNYHKPLERMLKMARKSVILRESIAETASYQYVRDEYLDDGVDLKVHVNTYARADVEAFIKSYGFECEFVVDQRTKGTAEMVIGYPHFWTFVVAHKI